MDARTPNRTASESTRPPVSSVAMVAKSVVCVALIAGLAWISTASGDHTAATGLAESLHLQYPAA
jgi:hypothetical protein